MHPLHASVRSLRMISPRAMLRLVHGVVVVVMITYAVGVLISPEVARPLAWVWAGLTLGTAVAAVCSFVWPGARVARTLVGVGVPLALAWRLYVGGMEIVTGTSPVGFGRALIVLSMYVLGLVFFPLYWARVVIPLSEAERLDE